MADIRINDLPNEPSPSSGDFLAVDGVYTRKTTIANAVNSAAPVASQAMAEAGTDNTSRMTALTTKQAIDFNSVPLSRSVFAGNGLSGGGVLSSDISISVGQGDGLIVDANSVGLSEETKDRLMIPGGTLGQVLSKASSSDYDLSWVSLVANDAGPQLKNVSTLLSDTTLTYSVGVAGSVAVGDIVRTKAEGFSYSVAASGASDNHIATAGGVKLYVLPGSEGFNVKAFGAVGNGSTDDTTPFVKAIAAASALGPGLSIICNGYFLTSSTLVIAQEGVKLVSTNENGGRFIRTTDFGPTFRFSNGSTQLGYVGLENIYIANTGTMTATSGAAVVFDMCYGVVMRDCYIKDCFSGLDLLGVSNGYIENLNISTSTGTSTGRYGTRIGYSTNGSRFGGDLFFKDCNFWCGEKAPGEGVTITPHMDYGFKVECVDGLWLTAIHVIATAVANYAIGNSSARACQNIFAVEAMSDISRGDGIRFEGTQTVYSVKWSGRISGLGQTDANKNGITIVSPCYDMSFNDVRIDEFDGDGVLIDNPSASNITFNGLKVYASDRDTSGAGSSVNINQGTIISFNGGHLLGGGKARWGYRFGGGASQITVNGVRVRDHVEGGVIIGTGAGFITLTSTDLTNNTNLGGVVISKPTTVPGLIIKDCLGYTPLWASQSWTPGAISNLGQVFVGVSVPGAELGDFVDVSSSIDLVGTTMRGYVSGENSVIVICSNFTGSTVTHGALTLRVKLEKKTF